MESLAQLFDGYSLRARVYPALITALPLLVLLISWSPELRGETGGIVVAVLIGCGTVYGMSVLARSRGRAHQDRLIKKWGGWQTTSWLRHSSGGLNSMTRARYHHFLAANVPGWKLPTEQEENNDPQAADVAYASACDWLREQCRGAGYDLVLKENTEFGYRRNMRGLRMYGAWLSILCVAAGAASVIILPEKEAELLPGSILFSSLALFAWLLVVNDRWVEEAGKQYARALLAACDSLPTKR